MEPHPVQGIGERAPRARSTDVPLVVGFVGGTLGLLVEGLVFVAVAGPHR